MAYEKQTFVDGSTVLKAEHLNHIEQGIVDVEAAVDSLVAEDVGARPDTWTPTAEQVGALPTNGGAMNGPLNMNSQVLWGLPDPTGYDQPVHYRMFLDELANKAPSGFGLGGEATIVNDLNNATACGWYYFGKGCANAPFDYGVMLVLNRLDTQIVQYVFEPSMNGEMIACIRVGRKNGTWYSWEAINPSMSVNAETRTTERYNGKIVYAKLVNFGAMPNATSKTVAYRGSGSTGVVSLTAMLSDGCCVSGGVCMDRSFSNVDTFSLDSTKYNVRITTASNWSSLSAYVLVKYTLD